MRVCSLVESVGSDETSHHWAEEANTWPEGRIQVSQHPTPNSLYFISSAWLGHIDREIFTLEIPDSTDLAKLGPYSHMELTSSPSFLSPHSLMSRVTHPGSHLGLGPLPWTVRCACYEAGLQLRRELSWSKNKHQRKAGSFCPDEFGTITLQRINFSPHASRATTDYFQLNLSNVTILPRTLMPLRLFWAVVKSQTISSPFLINVHNRSVVCLTFFFFLPHFLRKKLQLWLIFNINSARIQTCLPSPPEIFICSQNSMLFLI